MSTLAQLDVREMTEEQLWAVIRSELPGKTADEIRAEAHYLHMTVEEFRAHCFPVCPTERQAAELFSKIAACRDVAPLHKIRKRLRYWRANDEPGEARLDRIRRALERKLEELAPPPPVPEPEPPRNQFKPEPPQWTSKEVPRQPPPVGVASGPDRAYPRRTPGEDRPPRRDWQGWLLN